ncbi:hypothetical protein H0H92_001782 [Tricholoma furcatifolium]|nr:hypothetical protein H0H92_001782 [Tricholoma furcatifolium]
MSTYVFPSDVLPYLDAARNLRYSIQDYNERELRILDGTIPLELVVRILLVNAYSDVGPGRVTARANFVLSHDAIQLVLKAAASAVSATRKQQVAFSRDDLKILCTFFIHPTSDGHDSLVQFLEPVFRPLIQLAAEIDETLVREAKRKREIQQTAQLIPLKGREL